jgi:hypothetical protein
MAESNYERARRLNGDRNFYDRADYNSFLSKMAPGEKVHSHKFHVGDQESASRNPDSLERYIPCYVDGCSAELHPTYNEEPGQPSLEVHHEGTVKPFKGKVEGL